MDNREAFKSMLNNLINDKPEEATLDLHSYLSNKMKEVAGLAAPSADDPAIDTGVAADLESDDE